MGGKREDRRYQSFVYLACIILMVTFTAGCAFQEILKTAPSPDRIRLNRHMADYEAQIKEKDFQKAARTNALMLELLEKETTDDESEEITFLLTARTLLNQILSDQAKKADLAARAEKDQGLLKKKDAAAKTLETENKQLTTIIQRLEQENAGLAKQLEQMKQIDLK